MGKWWVGERGKKGWGSSETWEELVTLQFFYEIGRATVTLYSYTPLRTLSQKNSILLCGADVKKKKKIWREGEWGFSWSKILTNWVVLTLTSLARQQCVFLLDDVTIILRSKVKSLLTARSGDHLPTDPILLSVFIIPKFASVAPYISTIRLILNRFCTSSQMSGPRPLPTANRTRLSDSLGD